MILVNGAAADTVAATDRGFAYGDGVFRTMLARQGKVVAWSRHARKLAADCAALGIDCPPQETLALDIDKATDAAREQAVKIIVTRGAGARGYAPPQAPSPTRVVITGPVPDHPAEFSRGGVEVRLCSTRLAFQSRLAGVKHLNRLENVLARAEWTDPAIAEGLVMDADGQIVGGTMTNLFLVEAGELVTPALARCGVAGVTRERVIDSAARHGMRCRVEPVTWQRLERAEEALLVNSVIGAWGIKSCGERRWTPGRWTQRVREWLDEDGI